MDSLRWIILSIFMAVSTLSFAINGSSQDNLEILKDLKRIKKKGFLLSELGFPIEGEKSIRIKSSASIRYDENYIPSDGAPINLPIDSVRKHVARAHAVVKQVKDDQRFTSLLEGKNINLPIGIKKRVGNKDVIIAIDSLVFTPTHAYAVLYAIIEDTKNNKTLAFMGKDIRFTRDGGFTGDGRLELMETYDLRVGSSANISFLVAPGRENYIVFDCNGFKKLHVDARVFFSREKLLPENPDGTIHPSKQVTADFMTDIVSFDNWLVQISDIPKFQVKGLEGFSFSAGTIAFDYSSLENPTGIVFPEDYDSPDFSTGDKNLWEGFYINNLTVTLPEEFKLKADANRRITLSLENALIDKIGFTGRVSARPLIPLNAGDMNGWDYSIDYISIDIFKNTPRACAFNGQLVIPITKEEERFAYTASIQPNHNYNFSVTNKSNLNFPLWGAGDVDIYQDSWIRVTIADKKFYPEASLSGKMNITASVKGRDRENDNSNANNTLAIAQIRFEKIILKTTAPTISLGAGGSFSLGSPSLEQKLAKLPISISNIGIINRNNGSQMGITFRVRVNLTGENEGGGGFSGSTDLVVLGEYNNTNRKWDYLRTEISRIDINATIAVLALNGHIEFFREDPVYGSGFSGALRLKIDIKTGDILVDTRCIFGKMEDANSSEIFRYWSVDALASFPAFALFPGIIHLNAFGGGANFRMRMANANSNSKFVSLSGVSYVPDNSKGLGLKALLGIQGKTRKAYEGQLIFEIEFRREGGISQIAFSGFVQVASLGNFDHLQRVKSQMGTFVNKVNNATGTVMNSDRPSNQDIQNEINRMGDGGALLAQWRFLYDRDNSSFTANIDFFVDVKGLLVGVNPSSHAGRIEILFTPTKWKVHAGTPNSPLGANLIGVARITSYFMIGHDLVRPLKMPVPNAPEPRFPSNANNDASSGRGFGFGSRLNITASTGGSFYFSISVDAGFDILIYDVSGQWCHGKPKGIKGWYGTGQAFAYVKGRAGLKVCSNVPYPCNCSWCYSCSKNCWRPKCWGCGICRHNVCVDTGVNLGVGLSVFLEAANPTYFEGTLHVLGMPLGFKAGRRC